MQAQNPDDGMDIVNDDFLSRYRDTVPKIPNWSNSVSLANKYDLEKDYLLQWEALRWGICFGFVIVQLQIIQNSWTIKQINVKYTDLWNRLKIY